MRPLGGPARVTVVSGMAGSGKTVLLRSWISEADIREHAAWVDAGRHVPDAQNFWLSAVAALRATGPGSELVRAVSAAPDLDGWALVERLLTDLAPLEERLWLVVDDVHELDAEGLRQLELLLMRAPTALRFVLATRHDLRLGLHRLRLEGELAEIRAADLRFSLAEAQELFAAAGVELPEPAVTALHEQTEGWAAGLRLAALAATGHPNPQRFAAEFSGTERTVAEYLLAEVLERQGERVRRLLLRTSILDRVNGELADLLTGDEGSERTLQDLEAANAFVTSLDGTRSWFRYHQLFAGLLRLELRRTTPGEVAGLHRGAAGWLAGHGYPAEAIRHTQAARDWDLAARLLADHWPGLYLDGRAGAIHELVTGFPAGLTATDAGLAVVAAADELARGSLEAAERYLSLAERGLDGAPEQAGTGQARLLVAVVRLLLARQRGDLPAVTEGAGRLRAMAEHADGGPVAPGLGVDLSALALISLGSTEALAGAHDDSKQHLERGVELARRIGRPYLEFAGLAYLATGISRSRSLVSAADCSRQAIELARRHGWTDDPAFAVACGILGTVLMTQGRLEEAEPWVQRAERGVRTETEPGASLAIRYLRGMLEQARGRDAAALAAFQDVEPLARQVTSPQHLALRARAQQVHSLVRLGQTARAGQILDGLAGQDRCQPEIRIAAAALRIAQDDPSAALAELAQVLDDPVRDGVGLWIITAYALEAVARDVLGDGGAAERALERALDLAEPHEVLVPFLLPSVQALLERHPPHRTTHASLIAEIRSLYAGAKPVPRPPSPGPPAEPLSGSEIRVLRYLPTNLSAPEIARELSVSPNTVRTHIKNLYAKLGTNRRAAAVERARALGLLAPQVRTTQ